MTTCAVPARESDARLLPGLRAGHAAWQEEVRSALEPARRPDSGLWDRWAAAHYLQTAFRDRLSREVTAVNGVRCRLGLDRDDRLWAYALLLERLVAQAEHQMGLCQHGETFGGIAERLQRALGCWCLEVQEALGHLRWTELSPPSREAFRTLGK